MATPINIKDSDANVSAKVTKFGQLVTAPISYSTPITKELDTTTIAFNFIEPNNPKS